MALIIGLFDDSKSLQKGLEALQNADLSDDIVEVVEDSEAISTDTGPVAVAPSGTGGTAPMGSVAAAPFGMKASYLDRLGESKDFFIRAIKQGGCAVVLESRDEEKIESILQRAGAQQVYNNA
jgi:hypothetical protein